MLASPKVLDSWSTDRRGGFRSARLYDVSVLRNPPSVRTIVVEVEFAKEVMIMSRSSMGNWENRGNVVGAG